MSEQTFSQNYSKMNREQLLEAAGRLGIEEPETIPTVKELRELVIAYAANGAVEYGADDDDAADIDADAQNGPQSDESDNSDVSGADDGNDAPGADSGDDGTADASDEDIADAIVVPDGCLVVIGIEPADRCAFFEQHPDHPNGEVFVQGDQIVAAFPTPVLMRRVGQTLAIVEV